MDGLDKDCCEFALDGTCKLPPTACATCKIDLETSRFHGTLCVGAMTYDEVERKCGGKMHDSLKSQYGGRMTRARRAKQ